ncbi:hypothetical protein ACFLZP_02090 [Patescibacteria group bacterium]
MKKKITFWRAANLAEQLAPLLDASPSLSPSPQNYLLGDVNHSGRVDIEDAFLLFKNWWLARSGWPRNEFWEPDGSGFINGLDLGWVVKDWSD